MIACALCRAGLAHAQTPVAPDAALTDLAGRLGQTLTDGGIKRVAVLDLHGPQGESLPAGVWIADQLSSALQGQFPGLEVIDRARVKSAALEAQRDPAAAEGRTLVRTGHALGADAVVTGSYALMGQRLGITLLNTNLTHSGKLLPSVRGGMPATDEIKSLSTEEIPAFKQSVPCAGTAGISNPRCIRCPNPEYTDQARKAHYSGTVVLEVSVTPEGHTDNIVVISSPGLGLDKKSIETVKKWQFEPAKDLDDKPVATRVPIEISFRLQPGRP